MANDTKPRNSYWGPVPTKCMLLTTLYSRIPSSLPSALCRTCLSMLPTLGRDFMVFLARKDLSQMPGTPTSFWEITNADVPSVRGSKENDQGWESLRKMVKNWQAYLKGVAISLTQPVVTQWDCVPVMTRVSHSHKPSWKCELLCEII